MPKFFCAFLATAALVSLGTSSIAQTTEPDLIWDEYERFEPEKMDTLGSDSLRFSSRPALGISGFIVQLTKQENGEGKGKIVLLRGHPREGWFKTGELMLTVYRDEYAEIATLFDQAMLKGSPTKKLRDDAIIVCTDGPGYLAERANNGKIGKLKGFCGDHPNNLLAIVMEGLIGNAWVNLRR